MENLTLNKETQINWLKPTPRDREHSLRSFLLKIYISGTKEKKSCSDSVLSEVDGS